MQLWISSSSDNRSPSARKVEANSLALMRVERISLPSAPE
jgi:hypothetical protein